MNKSDKSKRVIIIGAGPSALVTARGLAEKGWNVEIFEALDRVGGLCRSFRWNEYTVDIGPHIFHTSDKKLENFWKKSFGDLLIEGTYWSQNVQGEKFDEFYDYPLSWESISSYPKNIKTKIIKEVSELDVSIKSNAKTYREYIDSIAGKTLRKMFFEKYPEKLWGIPVAEMAADWAPKRVNIYKKKTPFFNKQWTAVGKNGAGALYERIADEIKTLGGSINLNSRVSNIEVSGSQISSITSNEKIFKVDKNDIVISTIPVTSLLKMIGNTSSLKFRGVIIFYLDCLKKQVLPDGISWQYYDSKEVNFTRITEPKKMGIHNSSEDKSLITIEVPYSAGDSLDQKGKEILCQEIITQVISTGLLKNKDIIDITMVKEAFVYPVQYSGYQQELAKIESIIGNYEQLYSIGAGARFNYTDTQVLYSKAFDLVESLTSDNHKSFQNIKNQSSTQFNKIINLNGHKIGDNFSPYIIAEAGMNHNGDLNLGKKLIDAAITTGCDAIKFQTFLPNSRVSSKVKSVDFVEMADGIEETMYEMFSRLSMPFSEQKKLFEYAKDSGIEVFSTPFDFESVDFLESLGVSIYKIASMDLVNLPLIEYVAKTQKPIILSTGMSNLGMIEDSLNVIAKTGNSNVALLHCNSTYPAAAKDMNLEAINTLKRCFNLPVGLSDHTFGLLVSTIALSIGANIVERHFTMSKTSEGPDHILSSEPEEMTRLVEISKTINDILGDGIKRVKASEYDTINLQQKSLYALNDIKKGQVINKAMLTVKGPSGGLLPKYINIVDGRVASRDIAADFPITWEDI
jgi:sialic acid synthase SpsE/protoporphyrinogen oxidase